MKTAIMKTAIELADEFPEQNLANIEPDAVNHLNWWGVEAVAMLRQQAEQIDALKADAERIRECASRLVEYADFRLGGILSADSKAKDIPSRATSQVKARHLAALRDAIDATKDKT